MFVLHPCHICGLNNKVQDSLAHIVSEILLNYTENHQKAAQILLSVAPILTKSFGIFNIVIGKFKISYFIGIGKFKIPCFIGIGKFKIPYFIGIIGKFRIPYLIGIGKFKTPYSSGSDTRCFAGPGPR
jgi:hypothetical protein